MAVEILSHNPDPLSRIISWCSWLNDGEGTREERQDTLIRLAQEISTNEELADTAVTLGALPRLLHALGSALKTGDEDHVEVISLAVSTCNARFTGTSVPDQDLRGSCPDVADEEQAVHTYRFPTSGIQVRVSEGDYDSTHEGFGFRVWTSAQLLCEILEKHRFLVMKRTVVELGAGCGLCGLFAHELGAREVTITDGIPGCLPAIQRSCNLVEIGSRAPRACFLDWKCDLEHLNMEADPNLQVGCEPLGSPTQDTWPLLDEDEQFELVIGSDVLYEMAAAATLAATIKRRLKDSRGSVALVVQALRKAELIEEFICRIVAYGFHVTFYDLKGVHLQ
ncbi:hypothetical protein CYMTET_38259 [Cymbomonas tetramitiformis]|uniref:Uncharacterized protein n=1 Tax=Cymbomonas tetramitiformis TaxID=36881 RepID=A0AAE0CC99_9CHLO|nr:hypothetical protein CYMTET_38259 [Cymbomonas tetramitiformis]